jgi:hypothetical protein
MKKKEGGAKVEKEAERNEIKQDAKDHSRFAVVDDDVFFFFLLCSRLYIIGLGTGCIFGGFRIVVLDVDALALNDVVQPLSQTPAAACTAATRAPTRSSPTQNKTKNTKKKKKKRKDVKEKTSQKIKINEEGKEGDGE